VKPLQFSGREKEYQKDKIKERERKNKLYYRLVCRHT
jgi:hypothetical protein